MRPRMQSLAKWIDGRKLPLNGFSTLLFCFVSSPLWKWSINTQILVQVRYIIPNNGFSFSHTLTYIDTTSRHCIDWMAEDSLAFTLCMIKNLHPETECESSKVEEARRLRKMKSDLFTPRYEVRSPQKEMFVTPFKHLTPPVTDQQQHGPQLLYIAFPTSTPGDSGTNLQTRTWRSYFIYQQELA